MKKYFLLFLLSPLLAHAQGKLVLVGGGSEEIGGWSDIPYQRIVNQAANKRIAVISYTDETNFIPNYFLSLGAVSAINIKIDSKNLADIQTTYDSLMAFDAFFFKGGDQSFYYNYFKDTKTQDAIVDKFNNGGVLSGTSAGMSILSGVIFAALNDSVYPDEMLTNFKNSSVTLANDFLQLYPGFIFDTHFTERGRGARLIGFMTNWFVAHNELLTGIGVDDRTAFCIDASRIGSVFGTGTVSIYNSASFSSYLGIKPVADSIHVVQLLHGNSINLNDGSIIAGPVHPLSPSQPDENGNYQLLLSGGAGVPGNIMFLDSLIALGNPQDTVIIVTASGRGTAFKAQLTARGAHSIIVETSQNSNDALALDIRNTIRGSHKILFAENEDAALFDFLQQGPTGLLLTGHVKRNNIVSGFVGEDSRYAGKRFATNHLTDLYNAYYGKLNYRDGLGLLRTSIVMSNTYDANSSDYYENTTAAVPYAMIKDSLEFGIYLERNSFLKFFQQSGSNYFTARGPLSTIVITNHGTLADFESQPVNSGGEVRNYVGFTSMKYSVLNGQVKMRVGSPHPTSDMPYQLERLTGIASAGVEMQYPFPNPSRSGIFYVPGGGIRELIVTDAMGRILRKKELNPSDDPVIIDLSETSNGLYFLTWRTESGRFNSLLVKN